MSLAVRAGAGGGGVDGFLGQFPDPYPLRDYMNGIYGEMHAPPQILE